MKIMDDFKTPEFWISALTAIAVAVVAILVARGVLTQEEGDLWVQLVAALVGPVAVIVLGIIAKSYTAHQTAVRVARIQAGRE